MKKFLFFILILMISGTLFSSEVLNDSKNVVKPQTTSQNLFSPGKEAQADQLSDDLNGEEEEYSLKKETGNSRFKNAVSGINKKLGPIADLFSNTYFYMGLGFVILIGIFIGNHLKKTGYLKKTPRYSWMAIFSFILVMAGLVCGLIGLWPLLTTFGIIGLVLGTVSYHLIKQSKGDLKGKGFAIASNIIGNLEVIAVLIFLMLFAGFGG